MMVKKVGICKSCMLLHASCPLKNETELEMSKLKNSIMERVQPQKINMGPIKNFLLTKWMLLPAELLSEPSGNGAEVQLLKAIV